MIITEIHPSKLRDRIREAKKKGEIVIIPARDSDFNRMVLEIPETDILLSPEKNQERDGLKQLSSGLNNVLCEIAAKSNIAIGIDLDEIARLPKEEKAKRLARINQNIKLCKKAKCKIKVFSSLPKPQISSLLLSLGADTSLAKQATS